MRIYGRSYTWSAALKNPGREIPDSVTVPGACPCGWHVPADTEWRQLADYLGNIAVAGGKMKMVGVPFGGNRPGVLQMKTGSMLCRVVSMASPLYSRASVHALSFCPRWPTRPKVLSFAFWKAIVMHSTEVIFTRMILYPFVALKITRIQRNFWNYFHEYILRRDRLG